MIGKIIIWVLLTYERIPWKTPDLPKKYPQVSFPTKNDSFLTNRLPVIEHPVKNKENVKFLEYCWKYGQTYLASGNSSFIDNRKWGSGDFCHILLKGGVLFLFRHSIILLTSEGLVIIVNACISWLHFSQVRVSTSWTFWISLAQLCLEALLDTISLKPSVGSVNFRKGSSMQNGGRAVSCQ